MSRKFDELYLTVRIHKSSKDGARKLAKHLGRPRSRDGIVETGLESDQHRLLKMVGYGPLFGKMPLKPDFKEISELTDINFKGGKTSDFTHKHIVLSLGDPIAYDLALVELEKAVDQYVACWLPFTNVTAWYHVDKAHVHAHLLAVNWDEKRQTVLRWKRPDILKMNALKWYKGVIKPGAFIYERSPDEKAPKVYPKAATDVKALISLVAVDNPVKMLGVLEKQGMVKPYRTDSGAPGWIFRGRKITLAKLNFELKNQTGFMIGIDGRLYKPGTKLRTPLQQSLHFNIVNGGDEAAFNDFNDGMAVALSATHRVLLGMGQMPKDDGYQKHAGNAVFKALRYDNWDDSDEAVKPILGCLRTLLRDTPAVARGEHSIGSWLIELGGYLARYAIMLDCPTYKSMQRAMKYQSTLGMDL